MDDTGIQSIFPHVAEALFGDDAFLDKETHRHLDSKVKKFIDVVMANSWHRYRKVIKREGTTLTKLRERMDKLWAGECNIVLS
jgi:hypothetical protein